MLLSECSESKALALRNRTFARAHASSVRGVLKLINLDRIAVAFSGNIPTARSVVEALADALNHGVAPRKALEDAIVSNGPFDRERAISLIAGIPSPTEPVLLAFNEDGPQRLHEIPNETIVQIGSVPSFYESLTSDVLLEREGRYAASC
jgi:hypothetical protein